MYVHTQSLSHVLHVGLGTPRPCLLPQTAFLAGHLTLDASKSSIQRAVVVFLLVRKSLYLVQLLNFPGGKLSPGEVG